MYSSSRNYTVCIEPIPEVDGGGWKAYAPELPGCMADGNTRSEALSEIESAIEEWIDEAARLGRETPVPESDRKPVHA